MGLICLVSVRRSLIKIRYRAFGLVPCNEPHERIWGFQMCLNNDEGSGFAWRHWLLWKTAFIRCLLNDALLSTRFQYYWSRKTSWHEWELDRLSRVNHFDTVYFCYCYVSTSRIWTSFSSIIDPSRCSRTYNRTACGSLHAWSFNPSFLSTVECSSFISSYSTGLTLESLFDDFGKVNAFWTSMSGDFFNSRLPTRELHINDSRWASHSNDSCLGFSRNPNLLRSTIVISSQAIVGNVILIGRKIVTNIDCRT